MASPPDDLSRDLRRLIAALRAAGVPGKLVGSIHRKSLRTPRRQTGRLERRTNRQSRWLVSEDHPDYCAEPEAQLVFLRLLLDILRMTNAPAVDKSLLGELHRKYFGQGLPEDSTADPLTGEPLDYNELVEDIVTNPKHGYSKFHIGHQNPKLSPKHASSNIRWQLKSSNDFQGTMDVRVARIALKIDHLTANPKRAAADEVTREFERLRKELGIPD